jgi:hypothetical protein
MSGNRFLLVRTAVVTVETVMTNDEVNDLESLRARVLDLRGFL